MEYIISMGSYFPQTPAVAKEILEISELEQLIFPARLAVAPKKEIIISNPQGFDFSKVPKEFHPEYGFQIPLTSEDGIEFNFYGAYTVQAIPSTIVIRFTTDHLDREIIDLDVLQNIVVKSIPLFQSDTTFVYDLFSGRRPEARNYFKGPQGKNHPIRLDWITYYSNELVEFLGKWRFDKITSEVKVEELQDGSLIIIQTEPFEENDRSHSKHRRRIEKRFGVKDFV